ncbi:MAG: hypothetical protein QOD66_3246 [Solirubrobacteraceae bacterium]|nr:hypothetical protein [Solirubrobacteraceae bacterium]
MGQRSRKRGRRGPPARPVATAARPPARTQPPSRSEQRNAAVRATLTPLQEGERPWPIIIASVLAVLVGAGDLIDVIVGGRITFGRTHAGVGGVVLFSLMMLVCAAGMWRLRYWAVLGFQTILAVVVLVFSLLLIRASNLLGLLVGLVVVGGGGTLFYKLVRVLSRLQMPKYPGR